MMKKFLFVLSGLLLWLGVGAQEAEDFKITHGPYLQQLGEEGVTVVWTTNRDAASWVELAPVDGSDFYTVPRPKFYESKGGRRVIGTLHKIELTGLEPGTAYRYRIYSQEVTRNEDYYVEYGRTDATPAFKRGLESFTTFDNRNEKSVRFTVVNDIHERNDLLTDMVGDVEGFNPRLVIFNGDMATTLRTREQIFESFMDKAVELFATDIPIFYARGNHETRGRASYEFLDYFPSPTGREYYTFRCGPAFFIMLDGGEDKPDSDIEYFGLGDYDRFREDEARWLAEVVESAACKEAPYRIAIMHITPVRDDWYGGLHAKRLFVPILNRANIDVMFCGHTHRHFYVPAGEEGCAFPVVVNANETALDVVADEEKISVKMRDRDQKVLETFDFPRKR